MKNLLLKNSILLIGIIILISSIFIKSNKYIDTLVIISGLILIFFLKVLEPVLNNIKTNAKEYKHYFRPIVNIIFILLVVTYIFIIRNYTLIIISIILSIVDILSSVLIFKDKEVKSDIILISAMIIYAFIYLY